MDVFVPGEGAEFLDARLHIVARAALALIDRCKVGPVDNRAVGVDCLVWNFDAPGRWP